MSHTITWAPTHVGTQEHKYRKKTHAHTYILPWLELTIFLTRTLCTSTIKQKNFTNNLKNYFINDNVIKWKSLKFYFCEVRTLDRCQVEQLKKNVTYLCCLWYNTIQLQLIVNVMDIIYNDHKLSLKTSYLLISLNDICHYKIYI